MNRLVVLVLSLALSACAGRAPRPEPVVPVDDGIASTLVAEAFVTSLTPVDNVDSIATWIPPEGGVWLIATAKDSGRLIVFDGNSGRTLQTLGSPGSAPGQFARPNGIAVFGDFVFVVERDNHRLQVLHLPDFTPAGLLGADVLLKPYGLWLRESAPLELEIDVTDSYQNPDGSVPPVTELGRRVKRFRVLIGDGEVERAALERVYGDTTEAGAIRWIESVVGDPQNNRLLIPEEYIKDEPGAIRLYDMQGRYTGADLGRGLFGGQPEGMALYACADGSGYWIATDQQLDSNRFHVFERRSLAHVGTFHGHTVAFTDGVALHAAPTARFPAGAFYAVHHDQGVVAFDWLDIARALNLQADCRG
ncbi:MAG: phytase [Chiayiivirga sp.]|jgi:3-phytase|uniref:phytase n=1 Tax=Chiayiivirga sp. TaxID=2041042 RepID=UPI0025C2942D|nr:phytase [Chiayiivirga sp.]MCI1711918.1 phytase [Chiayiivirga sp.]MCI1729495.1 phytase [Chiayiivirga sp.]